MLIVNAVAMLTREVGDYVYRVEQPSIAMGKTGKAIVITVNTISPWFETLCRSAGLLVLHLLSEHDLLPIIEDRKLQGRPTVYELSDNIISLHSGIGIRKWFSDPINLSLAFQYMRIVNAVQVTGQGFAEQFAFVNPQLVAFQNQMAALSPYKHQAGARVLIGWAGSSGHRRDIEEISYVISDVIRSFPNVDFAIMGDKIIYEKFSTLLPPDRIYYTPPGTLEEYLNFLQQLDIGIAPLQDNPYNHCRSDIKFLEYASKGVVPVLRSLTPYKFSAEHGKTAFLYDTTQQLKEILSRLVNNTELRENVSFNAYEYVKNSRMEDLHADRRLDFYTGLMDYHPDSYTVNKEIPLFHCYEGSEYYEVETCEAESLLLEGIQLASRGQDNDAEKRFFSSASSLPEYPLPWFWLGYCAIRKGNPQANEWFDEAIKRNPNSLRAYWLKAKLLKNREPSLAFSEMADLFTRYPNYAPAAFFMAEVLEEHGSYDESRYWYDEALRANPFFSSAALGLGRIYEIQNKTEEAGLAYGTAADMAPCWPDAQYAMAKYCLSRNDLERAADYCIRALEIDPNHNGAQTLSRKILS